MILRLLLNQLNVLYSPLGLYLFVASVDPIAKGGSIVLDHFDQIPVPKTISIQQIQLEQDTAKSIHEGSKWLLDMNRAGVGLIEIVTAPNLQTSLEAGALVKHLQSLLRGIGVSYANLEEGSLRMDVNVSVSDGKHASERVELKNIATVTGLMKALGTLSFIFITVCSFTSTDLNLPMIDFEIHRQSELLKVGQIGAPETRGWDPVHQKTYVLRSKDTEHDYRYMVDADLPALRIEPSDHLEIEAKLPETPSQIKKRLNASVPCLSIDQINWLVEGTPVYEWEFTSRITALRELFLDRIPTPPRILTAVNFYESMLDFCRHKIQKDLSLPCFHWLSTELMGRLMKEPTSDKSMPWKITPEQLASIPCAIESSQISGKAGKKILDHMLRNGTSQDAIAVADELSLTLIQDSDQLHRLVLETLAACPPVKKMKREAYVSWIVGQVLKRSNGRAHPGKTREMVDAAVPHEN